MGRMPGDRYRDDPNRSPILLPGQPQHHHSAPQAQHIPLMKVQFMGREIVLPAMPQFHMAMLLYLFKRAIGGDADAIEMIDLAGMKLKDTNNKMLWPPEETEPAQTETVGSAAELVFNEETG